MLVMDEDNTQIASVAINLEKVDSPKKAVTARKGSDAAVSSDAGVSGCEDVAPSSPKVNGLTDSSEKVPPDDVMNKENDGNVCLRSSSASIEIVKEGELKGVSAENKEKIVEEEKSLEPHDLRVTCTQTYENFLKTSQNEKNFSSNKIISISVEQCQTNSSSVNVSDDSSADKLKKPKPIMNRKRSNKSTDSDDSVKINNKRIKVPDQMDQDEREKTVSECVEKASGSSLEELQLNTEKLQQEIHSLSALARAKELEWNDIIRLKKVKEEIYLRLVRRKQVMLLSMGGSGRLSDSTNWDFASDNRMTEFVTNDEVTYNTVTSSASARTPRLPSNLTITKSQVSPNQNLQRFLMQQPQGSSESKPNTSLMMVPIVSSTPLSISSTSSYMPRSNLGTPLKIPIPDRDKLKAGNNRNVPVPILPKPNQNVNHSVSNHSPPIGRQGPIVDVKSIIADYRQNHPEQVPRRGRRPKGQPSHNFAETMVSSGRGVLSMSSLALGSGSQVRTVNSNTEPSTGPCGHSGQDSSRPSSADSNRSSSNVPAEAASSGVSFKDVLVQFAKMSQNQQGGDRRNLISSTKSQSSSKIPPYPEVTLHPVLPAGPQSPPNPSSSLLHGILTKNNNPGAFRGEGTSRTTAFSPTLARLLTTPDRSSIPTSITAALKGSNPSTTLSRTTSGPVSITDLLSTSKNRNELTITPIVSNLQPAKIKEDIGNGSDEDPEDNADRLVIDESEEQEVRGGEEEELEGDSIPECQGCHMKSAQFVCAGCGNQWYCSRSCQVSAWDEHSVVCSG